MTDNGRARGIGEVTTTEARESDWTALSAMIDLEREEMAAYGTITRDADGLPVLNRADRYRDQDDSAHQAWLLRIGPDVVGFALIRPVEGRQFIDAFWLSPSTRGAGAGRRTSEALLRSRPGEWALAFLEENAAAAALWRTVIETVGTQVTESSRVNGGTTFTWIEFDVSDGSVAAE